MQSEDLLWVNFVKVENAIVEVFHGDKRKFQFINGAKSRMITGMTKSVDVYEQIYISISAIDSGKRVDVIFDSFIEIGPINQWEKKYAYMLENPASHIS
jgi:hypothetical protein